MQTAHSLHRARRALPAICGCRRVFSSSSAHSRIGETWESFFEPAHKVSVTVPATTSNLGPGFDSFGLALNMRNKIIVERADEFSITVHGEGEDGGGLIKADESNLVVQFCKKALESMGKTMPPLRFECHNTVPPQRGLGSSSSAFVAGIAAGFALGGKEVYAPLSKKAILQMAADAEGHADNISAAIYGGLQVNFRSSPEGYARAGQWITQRVHVPSGLHCVLFIPDEKHLMARGSARGALPELYTRADAVHNIGRAAMLINCFATGQFDAMRFAMEDRLHQPYRAKLFPHARILEAALKAGAHGAFLSAQGPTVIAVCGGSTGVGQDVGSDTMSQFLAEAVSIAMRDAALAEGMDGEVHVAMPSEEGLTTSGWSEDGTPLWGQEWEEALLSRELFE